MESILELMFFDSLIYSVRKQKWVNFVYTYWHIESHICFREVLQYMGILYFVIIYGKSECLLQHRESEEM